MASVFPGAVALAWEAMAEAAVLIEADMIAEVVGNSSVAEGRIQMEKVARMESIRRESKQKKR